MNGLRALVEAPEILVAPGIYDALSGHMAERAGFRAAYLSGASVAYTRFGRPDLGLVAMSEVADTLSACRERISIPLMVDADTGFGNALNVIRTVKLFARCGADAIQLEDQSLPKRCGHLDEKRLVSAGEMTGKIKAALDARPSEDVLIIARTDAVAVEGLAPALERVEAYREAGADILFVEALRSDREIAAAMTRLGGTAPLLANMVEGGKTPVKPAAELQRLGFSAAIFPGGLVRALTHTMAAWFASLAETGTTDPFRDRMLDFDALNDIVGTGDMLDLGKRYE
ncbi:MAG: oxaloacetate decarboxylase [Rhodospirillaceae bacterium]|nr:oxaloacetate decarboxylase [Rhodospirillaceae bacterium]